MNYNSINFKTHIFSISNVANVIQAIIIVLNNLSFITFQTHVLPGTDVRSCMPP